MESSGRFKTLSHDLIVNIMSRLDGCSIIALASTCTDLQNAARDEILWKKLCHETWPSTSTKQLCISFKSLYLSAFPLILNDHTKTKLIESTLEISSSPQDLTSFVDVYFKGHCIFSTIIDGLTDRTSNDDFNRFLYYPFKLDLFHIGCHDFSNITNLPLDALTGCEEREHLCNQISRDIRISWIILDKRNGKAVNISSWKPQSTHKSYEEYTVCFGCIVPVEDSSITHMLAECVIAAKFKVMIKQECIRWNEITLVIKDIDGTHLNGKQSMMVMNRALVCARSVNHWLVENGYKRFCKMKVELKLRNEQEESVANILSATTAIAALLGICYACSVLL